MTKPNKQYNKKPLTDLKVKTIKPEKKAKKHSDAHGLYLLVNPNGSKYWRLKYRLFGKEKVYSIGTYPLISLADARIERDKAKKLIKQGINPTEHRTNKLLEMELKAKNTFKHVAMQWHEEKSANDWKANHAKEVLSAMERELFPFLGAKPISDINSNLLKKVLKRVHDKGSFELLRKLKQWCVNIFNLAIEDEHITHNPAPKIKVPKRTPKHFNCIPVEDFPKLITDVRNYEGDLVIKYGIQMVMLTALRTEELRRAEWSELDFKTKTWTVPAQRLKWWRKYKDESMVHIVPLSKQAIEILYKLKEINGHRKHIFASLVKPKGCISNNSMLFTLYRLGYSGIHTIHAYRTLFSTISNSAGKNRDHIEIALAHRTLSSVRDIYNQSDYLEQRRLLMSWWADKIDSLVTGAKISHIGDKRKIPGIE